MIARRIEHKLKSLFRVFPVVSVTGPRQSGKTTLVKHVFKDLPYASLEDPDNRILAQEDPRGFLGNYGQGAIIDEAQRVPELFSYLQGIVDEDKSKKFVLTGSQNFLLSHQISQSLAGRVGILHLLPFSMAELKASDLLGKNYSELSVSGFYPGLYANGIPAGDFYRSYVQTYVERDVRQITKITDLHTFSIFLKLCAGRVGQLLNLSSLANDLGVSSNTVKAWINILESSFIVHRLYPHHRNFNKRLVKMPKLYFYDTGLLCHLLNVKNGAQLDTHFAKGAVFENLIISEIVKSAMHQGNNPDIYFWRDHVGKEVDLILEDGDTLVPIEIKAGKTRKGEYFSGLEDWNRITKGNPERSYVVYGGSEDQVRAQGKLLSWQSAIDYPF